jgi:phosphatidylserine/phosphatidylglycerophosphate/cardiolipin synthase-like enzyme
MTQIDQNTRSSLHAKLVDADNSHVLIGSANLTDAAFSRNIEIGASIALPHVAASIRTHIESLVRENALRQVPL